MRMNKTASSAWSIMALFAASMTTSCSSDSLVTDGNADGGEGKSVTLTAKVNEGDATTRVGMNNESDDEVSFYWHSDDAILVQTENSGTYSGAEFTTSTATGEASAEFTGTVESESTLGTYAVYPYSASHKFTSATALTYNLPATYIYNKVESGIFSKTDGTNTTYRSTSTNIPMVGTISGDAIEFKHIGGLAVIRIDEMPVESGTLTVTADQQLCGDFTISDLSADGAAIATSTSAATTDNKTVTFSFSGATTNEVGVFYPPLATGSYSGLKITISYGTTTQTVNYGTLDVARGDVVAIPVYYNDGNCYAKDTDGNYIINGHTFVDLGLTSGLLWATCNVGASSPTESGGYYAWGEVSTKETYYVANYKYGSNLGNPTKYNGTDKLTTLEAGDDAATANWGSGCRMPTKDDFDELINSESCTLAWTTVDGVSGYTVTNRGNGKSIFFPASGYRYDASSEADGYVGFYWTSTFAPTAYPYYVYAYSFMFSQNKKETDPDPRNYGYQIRPVADSPVADK